MFQVDRKEKGASLVWAASATIGAAASPRQHTIQETRQRMAAAWDS